MEINNNKKMFCIDDFMREAIKQVDDLQLRKSCLLITQEFSRRGIADLDDKDFKEIFLNYFDINLLSESQLYDLFERVIDAINKKKSERNEQSQPSESKEFLKIQLDHERFRASEFAIQAGQVEKSREFIYKQYLKLDKKADEWRDKAIKFESTLDEIRKDIDQVCEACLEEQNDDGESRACDECNLGVYKDIINEANVGSWIKAEEVQNGEIKK